MNLSTRFIAAIFIFTSFFMSLAVYSIINFFLNRQFFHDTASVIAVGCCGLLFGALGFLIFHLAIRNITNKVVGTLLQVRHGDLSARLNINHSSVIGDMGKELDATIETLEALHFHLYNDPLTQLPNRLSLSRYYEQCVLKCEKKDYYLYLIDLDNFKGINDLYGHQMGDKVLQELSNRMRNMCLPNENLFRFAGDEFVMIVAINKDEDIDVYTSKIKAIFSKPLAIDDRKFDINMSIGISSKSMDGNCLHTLLEKADQQMYNEKQSKHYPLNFRRNVHV